VASAVQLQARMIESAGGRVTVVALEDGGSAEARAALGRVPLVTAPAAGPAMLGFSPTMARRLAEVDPDLLHLHGIWTDLSRIGANWARGTGRPYLISPHGMLDPWITARGRWKKALARAGYERASWRRADAFHALTEAEAQDIRREAGERPVLVIPNPGPPAVAAAPSPRPPRVLYLGRIHPKKNLLALVQAWHAAALSSGAELAIAGWGEAGDVAELERAVQDGPSSVCLVGPVEGEAKDRLLAEARFMVLPSHSEGLPMAILEAWAAGVPTVMTAACHLPEGFAAGAALECGTDAGSIAAALGRALQLDESRWRAMSEAAWALARGPFSAEAIAKRWVAAYRSLAHGRER
jgi:poly(glycerol-phosphate) alpha-glucosyltransferase